MGEIKDYVFYIITKKDERYNNEGYSYGIQRNSCYLRHWSYLAALRDIEPYFFEEVNCTIDWSKAAEELAQSGNVIIVNTAIEVEEVKDRMYGIYLPSSLTEYQIKELNSHMDEFDDLDIDVDVQGELRPEFCECRVMDGFDSHAFLKNYLRLQEDKISKESEKNKEFKKVMS